jgi:hypothetical protein
VFKVEYTNGTTEKISADEFLVKNGVVAFYTIKFEPAGYKQSNKISTFVVAFSLANIRKFELAND